MNNLRILKFLPHYLRKKFNEKIIIIESDDWGLERGLNKNSIEFIKQKYSEEKFSRWTTDALETDEDLEMLYDLLEKYKSKFEHSPVITANFITHNIDYSSENELRFIPLSNGFNSDTIDVRNSYIKGIENKYIYPQLHGYSHYNLTELRKYFYTTEAKEAFQNGFMAGRTTIKGNLKFLQGELSKENQDEKIKESAEEFMKTFGFNSDSLIPPTFILDQKYIAELKKNGITMLQSSNRLINSIGKRYSVPFLRIRNGIVWSIRNARLDPHVSYGFYHGTCLEEIRKAFENKLPAVIDFHRVNISGKYVPKYRDRTLSEMKNLFDKIYELWPEAKFLNSSELNKMVWQQEIK